VIVLLFTKSPHEQTSIVLLLIILLKPHNTKKHIKHVKASSVSSFSCIAPTSINTTKMGPRDSFPLNSNPTHYQENGHIMSASHSQHSRTRSSSPPKPALNITTTFPTQSHSRQPSQTYPQKSYSIPRPQQSSNQNQTFAPPPTKPTSSVL